MLKPIDVAVKFSTFCKTGFTRVHNVAKFRKNEVYYNSSKVSPLTLNLFTSALSN